ncbi:MAG: peptidoglycan DD-metalloendopeptidase family protein [Clostridiales bacterium]|jgi:murein DD-endopeptidase MepM/ murein hydrolase activator NlpD|nr:peptidoglycan DD-metalloendopeptidase family protein [Clostridiales bacterium]
MEQLKRSKFTMVTTAAALAAVIAFNGVALNAGSVSDLKTKQTEIAANAKKAKALLEDAKLEKNAVMAEILQLDVSVDEATEAFDFITAELDKTVSRLGEAEIELADAEIRRETQYESLKKRMRYMYINGNVGYLDVLLASADFSDFINRFEYINRMIEHDETLVGELEATEQLITERINEIDIKKKEQEILASGQEEKLHALEEARDQKQSVANQLDADEAAFQQQLSDLEKSGKEIEAQIRAAEAKAAAAKNAPAPRSGGSSAPVTYNGRLGWPVPGKSYISSDYGYRTSPRKEFHTGIDIPTPTGSDIVAAESGTVVTARYMNGYGYTVVISHGGGLSTLYGHNSKLVVSEGESISRGQVIAKAGSTGYSTGPHCHFEVRANGGHTNPWTYLKG